MVAPVLCLRDLACRAFRSERIAGNEFPPSVRELDLSANNIHDLAATLRGLSRLPLLVSLSLYGNPAAADAHYRRRVLRELPYLQQLDRKCVLCWWRQRCVSHPCRLPRALTGSSRLLSEWASPGAAPPSTRHQLRPPHRHKHCPGRLCGPKLVQRAYRPQPPAMAAHLLPAVPAVPGRT